MKITKLTCSNILRLNAVAITPDTDGNLIIVGGNNEQGKSSLINCIPLGFDRRHAGTRVPLKRGAETGFIDIEIDLGELNILRTFNSSGREVLTVTGKDGEEFSSPQKLLDKFYGKLTFDPLAFAAMDPKTQDSTLLNLLGLDFTKLDAKRKGLYDDRTISNREVKRLEALVDEAETFENVPDEEVSVSDLSKQLEDITGSNRAINNELDEVRRKKEKYREVLDTIETRERNIRVLQEEARTIREEGKELQKNIKPLKNTEDKIEQIATAEETNEKIKSNHLHTELSDKMINERDVWKSLTAKIEAIDLEKEKALSSAKFPIEELSFGEDGILYKGVPFSQASASAGLKVSTAMGMALNPELNVLLIRDASLLDKKSWEFMAKIAKEKKYQFFMEKVSTGDECSVIIEDGRVQGQEIKESSGKQMKVKKTTSKKKGGKKVESKAKNAEETEAEKEPIASEKISEDDSEGW